MTETQIHRVSYPTAPSVEKLRGTLLDTATVDDQHFAGIDGLGLYESYNCMDFGSVPANCGPSAKSFDNGPTWVDGVKFGAYGGVICKHTDEAELEAQHTRSMESFLLGESRAVERGLMALRFPENDNTATMLGEWPAPVDFNSAQATPVDAEVGVALAEEWIASVYAGIGTLHLPRSVASLLANGKKLEFEGDTLRTALGTKVAAGSGYALPNLDPAGAEADFGVYWIYVTGEVLLMRSDPVHKSAHRSTTNEYITLVERGYVASIDCNIVGAIPVTVQTSP